MNNLCIECGKSTAMGSGLFVNRLLVVDDEKQGFLCHECQQETCDDCGEKCFDYQVTFEDGCHRIVCGDCLKNVVCDLTFEEEMR